MSNVFASAAARMCALMIGACTISAMSAAQSIQVPSPATPAVTSYQLGSLTIETPWMRQAPDGARVAGGYLRIINTGKQPDRLIGGAVTFAKRFEVHEMAMEAGVMRMRELAQGIEIKPGETVELKPGGLHVMFMDVIEQPRAGRAVKSTLQFQAAGAIDVEFSVVERGAGAPGKTPPADHKSGHKHH